MPVDGSCSGFGRRLGWAIVGGVAAANACAANGGFDGKYPAAIASSCRISWLMVRGDICLSIPLPGGADLDEPREDLLLTE